MNDPLDDFLKEHNMPAREVLVSATIRGCDGNDYEVIIEQEPGQPIKPENAAIWKLSGDGKKLVK